MRSFFMFLALGFLTLSGQQLTAGGCTKPQIGPPGPTGPSGVTNDTYGYIYRFDQSGVTYAQNATIPLNLAGITSSDVVANGTGFTVNRDGRYLVSYDIRPSITTTVFSGIIDLQVNGTTVVGSGTSIFSNSAAGDDSVTTMHGQVIVNLVSGDLVTLHVDPLSQNQFVIQSVKNSNNAAGAPSVTMAIQRVGN